MRIHKSIKPSTMTRQETKALNLLAKQIADFANEFYELQEENEKLKEENGVLKLHIQKEKTNHDIEVWYCTCGAYKRSRTLHSFIYKGFVIRETKERRPYDTIVKRFWYADEYSGIGFSSLDGLMNTIDEHFPNGKI